MKENESLYCSIYLERFRAHRAEGLSREDADDLAHIEAKAHLGPDDSIPTNQC